MQRDSVLFRKILLAVHSVPAGHIPDGLSFEGYTDEQIEYHSHELIQLGLATGFITTHINGMYPSAEIVGLTPAGYALANAIRGRSGSGRGQGGRATPTRR